MIFFASNVSNDNLNVKSVCYSEINKRSSDVYFHFVVLRWTTNTYKYLV